VVTKVGHPDPTKCAATVLMDLGFYPGGLVKLVLVSPKKDPKAYESKRGPVIGQSVMRMPNYIQGKNKEKKRCRMSFYIGK